MQGNTGPKQGYLSCVGWEPLCWDTYQGMFTGVHQGRANGTYIETVGTDLQQLWAS